MDTMNVNNALTTTEVTPAETTSPSPQYEADARAKIAAVRAMAADFALPAPRSLTSSERRAATATPPAFVEKPANSGQTVPRLSEAANAAFTDMRDGWPYANAYH